MGVIFLLILWFIWVVNSGATALWWTGGIILLIIVGCVLDKGKGRAHASGERPRPRIEHPHYITADDYC